MPDQNIFLDDEGAKRKHAFIKAIPFLLLFWFLIAFLGELKDVLRMFLTFSFDAPLSLFSIIYNGLMGFGLFFAIWLLMVSGRALLPVKKPEDVQDAAQHLLFYIMDSHGPAIFVEDGQVRASPEELRSTKPGVLLVDFNSSVVLERVVSSPGCLGLVTGLLKSPFKKPETSNRFEKTRICGPGVTFTWGGERIRGAGDLKEDKSADSICGMVDLRPQFRSNDQSYASTNRPATRAYTRDGIEVSTNVWATFTIGQNPRLGPDVIQAAYQDERRLENLHCVKLEADKRGLLKVTFLPGELASDDRREMHEYGRVADRLDEISPYHPLPARPLVPEFDENRVFSAVFARARTPGDEVISWTRLPSNVAMDLFREILLSENYDDLYRAGTGPLPVGDLKKKLRIQMRNLGLLSYRMVYHATGQPLEAGRRYRTDELIVSPIRMLTTPKVLRDRGIKVTGAGFGDLHPVSDAVYKQRLDSWRATWEKETALTQADYELQAMRVSAHARAQTQQELYQRLSLILSENGHSREAVAVRLFQSLEAVAADPATRQLLPADTINLMRTIHTWLSPGDDPYPLLYSPRAEGQR